MTRHKLKFVWMSTRWFFLLVGLFLLASLATSTQAAGEWTATGETVYGPMSHPAARLADGRVLVPGGDTILDSGVHTCSLNDGQIYDPDTDTWTATAEMGTARALHTAITLNDGRVLVTGGVDCTLYVSVTYNSAEIFDPASGTWAATGSLNTARSRHTATLLNDGRVLVVGGNFGGSAAEVFDPAGGTWAVTGSMTASHSFHTATLLDDGRVLVISGAAAEVFDPATGTWSATGSLGTARSRHTSTLLNDGRVLVVGGQASDGPSLIYFDSAEVYDPATGGWSATGSLGTARSRHTATLLVDGQVLVAGGTNPANLASVEIFDPATGVWMATGNMIDSRKDHTATQLDDGRILAVGGDGSGDCCAELFTLSGGGGTAPTPTPTATPSSATTMHVGDLDGSSTNSGGSWTALVTITVHDANENPVADAVVSGAWSNGASGTASCTTNSSGQCSVSKGSIPKRTGSVTFTVDSVTHATLTYDSAANHDPDGDSNGTNITVLKP